LIKNNNLVAGFRRIQAAKKLGWKTIPYRRISIDDTVVGEIHENEVREDYSASDITDIYEYIEKEKHPGRPKKNGDTLSPFSDTIPKGKTRELVAKFSGLSQDAVEKIVHVVRFARKEPIVFGKLPEQLSRDKRSINAAYKKVKKYEDGYIKQEALKKTQVNLPETVQLHNKDFRELKLQDNSVALIMTDPPYAEKDLWIYDELGRQASRVLREGGSLLCYAGHYAIARIINMVEQHGLKFHWPLVILHSGPSASVFVYKVMVGYNPLLWFVKGKYEGEFVSDVKKSEFQGKELHEWAKSTIESDYYIKHMTIENDIVYDPFLGQGTFGISAVKLKRQFIGCEINKDHFETARKLIVHAI